MASKPSPSNLISNPNSKPGSLSTITAPRKSSQPAPPSSLPATRAPSLIIPLPPPPPPPPPLFPSAPNTAPAQEAAEPSLAFADIPWSGAPAPASVNELPAPHPYPYPYPYPPTEDRDGDRGTRSSPVSPRTTLETLHLLHHPLPPLPKPSTFLIGISGAPSSGKTTFAHLLLSVFPADTRAFLIQQDDFQVRKSLLVPCALRYRSDSGSDGIGEEEYDADCASAYDMEAFKRILRYAKREGRLPGRYRSAQDVESEREVALGMPGVGAEVREELSNVLAQSGIFANGRAVGVVDGALLYPDTEIRELLDVKIFLRSSKCTSSSRRLSGPHVGGEFFWRTRPYFEDVVWRNYVREYAPLFQEGDVEGWPARRVCEGLRVRMQPGLDGGVGETVRLAVGVVVREGKETEEREGGRGGVKDVEEEGILTLGRGFGWVEKVRRKVYDWI